MLVWCTMTRAMFNVIGSAAVPEVLVIKEQHATVRSLELSTTDHCVILYNSELSAQFKPLQF